MDKLIAFLKRLALRVARVAVNEAIDGALDEARDMLAGLEASPKELAAGQNALDILALKLKARF